MADTPQIPDAGPNDTDAQFDQAFSPANTTFTPSAPPAQAPAPSQAAPAGPVNVINPTGDLVSIPGEQLADALSNGYQHATPEHVAQYAKEQKYGTGAEELKTAAEGAASAASFGLSTGIEKALGAKDEDIQGRREVNPGIHAIGQGAGLIGSALIPGVGAANVLAHAGEAGAALAGIEGAGALAKIGSAALKSTIENGLFQAGDEVSKLITSPNPGAAVETAVADIGLSGLIGGVIGGGLGAVSPLWKATIGKQTDGVLNALADKLGGVEGQIQKTGMGEALTRAGIEVPPEVQAGLSGNDAVRQMGKTLEQSDTTSSGLKYQEAIKKVRQEQIPEAVAQAFGRTAESIGAQDLSKAVAGKELGESIAKTYNEQLKPLKDTFDAARETHGQADLIPDQVIKGVDDWSNPYKKTRTPDQVIPGTVSQIADNISKAVEEQGWAKFPDGDEMKLTQDVLRNVKDMKNINDISKFASEIGARTKAWPPTPLTRAGQVLTRVLRDAEEKVLIEKVGAEQGAEALQKLTQARAGYRSLSELKEYLGDRLGLNSSTSTSNFGKTLHETASEEGEKIINRLSGKNNADTLRFLQQNFPEAAERLRNFHVDNLLDTGAKAAKNGELLNPTKVFSTLDGMSPELRDFVLSHPGASERLGGIQEVLQKMNELPHNFSNTARTSDKLGQYVMPTALSMATLLLGHGAPAAAAVGFIGKALAKDAPDAIRLAMLKFLGSGQPIEGEGFKAMVDYIHSTMKGENLLAKSSKALFQAGKSVLPEAAMPTKESREKLDARLRKIQTDPTALFNVGGKTGHYLPDHGQALSQTAARVSNYVNSQRPSTQGKSPLDPEVEPSAEAKAKFNRVLDIAEQPLVVMNAIKDGSVTPSDLVSLKQMYPGLYTRISQKITNAMADHIATDETVPYKTRVGMSLFMAQPLDSTMTPEAIQATQSTYAPKQAPGQPQGAQGTSTRPKPSSPALQKLPASYQTPSQAREAARNKT
jgi:hypothetical protein